MSELQDWFYRYNAWSFSKHRLWEQCQRAYYYQYIGPALKSDYAFTQQLKALKALDSRHILKGKLIHEVLEKEVDRQQHGENGSLGRAQNWYNLRVEHYRKHADRLMLEPRNGAKMKDEFFEQILDEGLRQLGVAFAVFWPNLTALQYLRHEKFDTFHAGPNRIRAIVKADHVGRNEQGQIVISDFKTGKDDPRYESHLQVGAYVLWAAEFYGQEPAQIKSELLYLATGKVKEFLFTRAELREIESLIVADFREMNRCYDRERFGPSPSTFGCSSCHFASVCPERIQSTERTSRELEPGAAAQGVLF